MSFVTLIFGQRNDSAIIGGLAMDVTLSVVHQRTAEATSFPIEDGSTISDHVFTQPERIRIEGFVTDNPALLFQFRSEPRAQNAFDTLDQLWKSRERVRLQTRFKTYDDMVIVDLTLPETRERALRFIAELQKIRTVASELREIPELAIDEGSRDIGAGSREAGRQPPQPAGEGTRQRTSVLREIYDLATQP